MKTIYSAQKPNQSKKSWVTPSMEIIEIKSKAKAKFLPGINLLDPHGTAS
ncbi:hypothetical protein [Emticicia fontis]